MQRTKRILTGLAATGVLAGAVAGGVAVATSAGATQQPSLAAAAVSGSGGVTDDSAISALSGTTTSATQSADGVRYLRLRGAHLVLRTSAAYLGLTPKQLEAQLKAGKSLATLASEHGKTASGLEDAIVAAATKRVDASQLSAARKAAVITYAKNNVDTFVNVSHPFEWAVKQIVARAETAQAATSAAA
jgi:hypothetical protein